MEPHRPTHIPNYAESCLEALISAKLNDKISLGGAFGLLHYLDYRSTHDVDAWWEPGTTAAEQEQIAQVIEQSLVPFGKVQRRIWGEVISLELKQEGRVVFSFQIAQRSARLEPSVSAAWIDIPLDSLSDLVASKMVALVERGAPRDFRDIYAICQTDLTTPTECWQLWRQRQQLAASDTDSNRARLALETHLTRIALHRPLEKISDSEQRKTAQTVRHWFEKEFLDALLD